MRYLNLILWPLCVLLLSTAPTPPDAAFAREMLAAVNALRARGCTCGDTRMAPAPPVRWNAQLAQAAQGHAADLLAHRTLGHVGSDGSTLSERVRRSGYRGGSMGENAAWGYRSIPAVVEGWRTSPGHCRNMMNPVYREMGAGQANTHWVQVFARPIGR